MFKKFKSFSKTPMNVYKVNYYVIDEDMEKLFGKEELRVGSAWFEKERDAYTFKAEMWRRGFDVTVEQITIVEKD